jgi:hypothetical protein
VWEVEKPHARELIEVDGTFWDGEEWWVRTHSLLTGGDLATPRARGANDLGRIWAAATPVGGGIYGLTERRPDAN